MDPWPLATTRYTAWFVFLNRRALFLYLNCAFEWTFSGTTHKVEWFDYFYLKFCDLFKKLETININSWECKNIYIFNVKMCTGFLELPIKCHKLGGYKQQKFVHESRDQKCNWRVGKGGYFWESLKGDSVSCLALSFWWWLAILGVPQLVNVPSRGRRHIHVVLSVSSQGCLLTETPVFLQRHQLYCNKGPCCSTHLNELHRQQPHIQTRSHTDLPEMRTSAYLLFRGPNRGHNSTHNI